MRKVIIAAALLVLGSVGVASAQDTPATLPKADSAAKWSHDSAMKQGAMSEKQGDMNDKSDAAMQKAGEMASIDVNTATQAQLEAVPALKPYADKIIAGRPYKSIDQLAEKDIIPKDVLSSTKGQLKVSGY